MIQDKATSSSNYIRFIDRVIELFGDFSILMVGGQFVIQISIQTHQFMFFGQIEHTQHESQLVIGSCISQLQLT